ncbi:MAG TPA: A/G-specific adenine glycosylase [Gammaproteobacteria bacterium]|nr:A/G-specific adenine glycosylase [Gammaproteobacteria bacterium]
MQLTNTNRTWFAKEVIYFAKNFGRFHLPWKNPATPYRVWVSEVMLQQTQVQSVLGYFDRFMDRFATIESLAQSPCDAVLSLWSGLGYYRRAHHLHQAAQIITQELNGRFPNDLETLVKLPGIGRSTAGAILAQGFNLPAPILDANVKRLLMRFFCIEGDKAQTSILNQLWELSTQLTPKREVAIYTQGIMDLGAMTCTKSQPKCDECPLQLKCLSFRYNKQHSIPEKAPKTIKPKRFCLFLVHLNAQREVYMLKRPNHGIWSGLWCFPILPFTESVNKLNKLLKCSKYKLGNEAKHTFTHFDLVYKPVMIQNQNLVKCKNKHYRWLKLEQLADFGIPSAVKKILQGQDFEQFKNDLLSQA